MTGLPPLAEGRRWKVETSDRVRPDGTLPDFTYLTVRVTEDKLLYRAAPLVAWLPAFWPLYRRESYTVDAPVSPATPVTDERGRILPHAEVTGADIARAAHRNLAESALLADRRGQAARTSSYTGHYPPKSRYIS